MLRNTLATHFVKTKLELMRASIGARINARIFDQQR